LTSEQAKTIVEEPKDSLVVEDAYGVVDRRSFLSWLTVGWAAFAGALGIMGAAFQRFLFPNVLREPPQQFKGMYPTDLADGVDETYKDAYGVWLVKGPDPVTNKPGICALSTICTHLGCTPNWLSGEEKFKCPCHGSGFRKNGINFEGPAPRPLERYKIALAEDGRIFVDKTRKFQFEKGQWSDPESFLGT
jgi:cytochrome b6-f complex iron-sulfur subunit